MDEDALIRSPLRCWEHDDCLAHPELGVLCGAYPVEMCVSDEQRFALPGRQNIVDGLSLDTDTFGNGDLAYTEDTEGGGGSAAKEVDDWDQRFTYGMEPYARENDSRGYTDGDGYGGGDWRDRQLGAMEDVGDPGRLSEDQVEPDWQAGRRDRVRNRPLGVDAGTVVADWHREWDVW